MIVIRVELHSARTGIITELARMDICNQGGQSAGERFDYRAQTYRGRNRADLAKRVVNRMTLVRNYPRQARHVWNLVAIALEQMGYGNSTQRQEAA